MIREVTVFDALEGLRLAEMYSEEAGDYLALEHDPDLAVARLIDAIQDDRQLFLMAFNSKGHAVGMLWAACAPILPWSLAVIAVDTVVYVDPAYRGTRHGLELIRYYEAWAEERGAREIRLSVGSGIHEEKTGKLYSKLGYEHLGTQYRRKLCH